MPETAVDAGERRNSRGGNLLRSFGLGIITGAADDDCSAVGTYSQAGAGFGYAFLWTVPFLPPMMVAVVYLSSKLGQVTGQGLFAVIRSHYPRWLLYGIMACVIVGNTIEAGADIGGIAAALHLLIPVSSKLLVAGVAAVSLALQLWGSYRLISNVFRALSLTLLAYVASMFLAHPDVHEIVRAIFRPTIRLNRESLAILVAMIGTALSAYLFTWQSNEEVEEKIATGQVKLRDRRGTTKRHLRRTAVDVALGMFFSALVMYSIIIATAATLHASGKHEIETAAEAAQALAPVAGHAAGLMFTLGIVGVGFLAIPVMTTGAAYDVCQSLGRRDGLNLKLSEGKTFYGTILGVMLVAAAMNFLGINPMKALVIAGIVQGFSTPPLMLLIMLLTNSRRVMGDKTNTLLVNVLGWGTTLTTSAASLALLGSYLR
ncbi:Nramp family divalent metal transporter [Edaphobacter sp. HDX4]|uniref:Nramp family divalent metal transporter n=1 Tax=Edaphobacter sp. HDX4 TaxID=2794064 RepID=UPI002FE5F77D